jgi:hypothetical protein
LKQTLTILFLFEPTWFFLPQWGIWHEPAPVVPSRTQSRWFVFAIAVILVSVPVFFQAPLVRWSPELGVVTTAIWWALAVFLGRRYPERHLGTLLYGFSWSWLAGSIYWGWLRMEPLWHLPIEAIALPLAIWGLRHKQSRIGYGFYLGSLCGTAITDVYVYLSGLIPYWRQVMMNNDASQIAPVLQAAVAQLQSPGGVLWALVLVLTLCGLGARSLRQQSLAAWAFGGAVLSTLLVDGLFLASVYLLI